MVKAETLMKQAGYTASHWMEQAIHEIDGLFGNGHASKHPELVVGFMQAAAIDQASMYLRSIAEALERIGNSLTPADND
ncbi:hypothetical protein [Serratia fonticola]|uniref:hypothetical protein n=1 Tax=Serratia fonticola TaxID=47917 RepID=UPI00301BF736